MDISGSGSGSGSGSSSGVVGVIDRALEQSIRLFFVRNMRDLDAVLTILSSHAANGDASNTDNAEPLTLYDGCIIDMGLVVSPFQLRIAAYRALITQRQGKMKTKALSSEIMYNLSPTTKITEAIKQVKVKPTTDVIALVVIDNAVSEPTESTATSIHKLLALFNSEDILSEEQFMTEHIHQVNSEARLKSVVDRYKILPSELAVFPLEDIVVNRLAMKDFEK
jgi:EKC/KEOPS complex subunit CGI121/TPRKB